MRSTKKSGDQGELIAIHYLQRKGYRILDTNYKFGRFGEVDIIASFGIYTVFFEVKYRSSERYGTGEESITRNKLYKIRRSAEAYCNRNRVDYELMKIEAIVIERLTTKHQLKHYKNLEF